MRRVHARGVAALFALAVFCLHAEGRGALAQEAGEFKVGDLVEATYAGEWKEAVIVGGYQDTEFGYGTYQVHFEGERFCNNHALDTRINARFVRARGNPGGARAGAGTESGGGSAAPSAGGAASASWPGQRFKAGDRVMYSDGSLLWSGPGEVTEVDAGKRQYTVRSLKDRSWRYSYPCYAVSDPARINNDFFVGDWDVYITGATSTFERGGDRYRRFSGGARLPPLRINADGTYVWRTDKGVVRGVWKPREGVPGITLLKGPEGLDYTVYEKTEGFATTEKTRDEIGLHHLPTSTGYFMAYRVGPNRSCVLAGRAFGK